MAPTPARQTVCSIACAIALGLIGLGAAPAHAASANAAARQLASQSNASRPKPKPRRATASSRKREETPRLELPTIPPVMQLPSVEELAVAGSSPVGVFTAPSQAASDRPFSSFSASAERLLSSVMERARSQLGTRYVFGGTRPDRGLDCSAFVRFAMEALGMSLPRTAAQQARIGTPVPRDRTMLKPGDLLTFGRGNRVSHVGIYVGEGRFIHASVASGRIIETTIERNGRLFRRWQGARRLIATGDTAAALRGKS